MKNIFSIITMLVITSVFFFFYDRQNQEISLLKAQVETLTVQVETIHKKSVTLEDALKKTEEKLKKAKKKKVKPVSQKKREFLEKMVKPLDEVYDELETQYIEIKELLEQGVSNERIEALKKYYSVEADEDLLIALKPHPKSIALAQGAMESAWGESRFFKEANNIFGVWSFNKNEPRIAAGSQRGDKTIWLKKYGTIKEAIKGYYILLSRGKAFVEFRKLNYENASVFELVKQLHRYSEKKDLYGKELANMIRFNNFTKYDKAVMQEESKELATTQNF